MKGKRNTKKRKNRSQIKQSRDFFFVRGDEKKNRIRKSGEVLVFFFRFVNFFFLLLVRDSRKISVSEKESFPTKSTQVQRKVRETCSYKKQRRELFFFVFGLLSTKTKNETVK